MVGNDIASAACGERWKPRDSSRGKSISGNYEVRFSGRQVFSQRPFADFESVGSACCAAMSDNAQARKLVFAGSLFSRL
jgi:hypothetical protein